jgi:hypothetical protein
VAVIEGGRRIANSTRPAPSWRRTLEFPAEQVKAGKKSHRDRTHCQKFHMYQVFTTAIGGFWDGLAGNF